MTLFSLLFFRWPIMSTLCYNHVWFSIFLSSMRVPFSSIESLVDGNFTSNIRWENFLFLGKNRIYIEMIRKRISYDIDNLCYCFGHKILSFFQECLDLFWLVENFSLQMIECKSNNEDENWQRRNWQIKISIEINFIILTQYTSWHFTLKIIDLTT